MPRRNRNPGQAQATHRLDRFEKWAMKIIQENKKSERKDKSLTET